MPQAYQYEARQPQAPVQPYSDQVAAQAAEEAAAAAAQPPVVAREDTAAEAETRVGAVGSNGVPGITAAQRTGKRKLTVAQLRAICNGELDI